MPAQTFNEITSFANPLTKHDKQHVTFSNYDGSALPIRLALRMALSLVVGELICSLIAKAGELSNFRLERESFPFANRVWLSKDAPLPRLSAGDPEKDRPLVHGAARRARKLDGEAPRRSS